MGIKNNKRKQVLWEGKFIRFVKYNSWEYIERSNCTGVVVILALTKEKKVVLTEQHRIPVRKNVIEFPAGLVNDNNKRYKESPMTAAKRELFEETGYKAKKMVKVTAGPHAGGSSADILTFVMAKGIQKVGEGGGEDEWEQITVHEVPISRMEGWLEQKRKKGCLVDPKIYAGLYFLRKYNRIN